MRYLVKARVKPGRREALLRAIDQCTLGAGSIAGEEYQQNMKQARVRKDGTVCWVETCFCVTPLEEERPYWEEYFDLTQIKDAHDRRRCRDLNGEEPWACCHCDCTRRLEQKMEKWGEPFLDSLAGPEAVKKFKTGGDREGEAPAEPHEARTCWGDGSPGASPSQFFHTFPR